MIKPASDVIDFDSNSSTTDWVVVRAHAALGVMYASFVGVTSIPIVSELTRGRVILISLLLAATLPTRRPSLPRWSYALLLASIPGVILSADIFVSLQELIRVAATILVIGLVAANIDRSQIRRSVAVFAVSATAVVAIVAAIWPKLAFLPIRAPLVDFQLVLPRTEFGKAAVAALALIAAVSLANQGMIGRLFGGLALIMALLTQARTFVLAGLIFCVSWIALRKPHRLVPTGIVIGLVSLVFGLSSTGRQLWDRESIQPEAGDAFTYRLKILDKSLDRFMESPLVGQGFGSGDVGLQIEIGNGTQVFSTHSEWETIATSAGVIGLAILCWGFVDLFRRALSSNRTGDWLPLATMIAAIPVSLFHPLVSRPSIIACVFLLLTLPTRDCQANSLTGLRTG